jgi:trans-aconitate methyltransferase
MAEYKYFAKVYDRMMDNIPYEEWKQYLMQLFFEYDVPPCAKITELGCGTGVMTRLLSDEGFAMTGVDISEEMLNVARGNSGSDITYINSDMRSFEINEKQDAIISICDSMNYLLTNDDLYRTMVAAHSNLKGNGVFIFDLKTEYFFRSKLDGKTFAEDMGDFSYVWKNHYDSARHVHQYRLLFTYEENDNIIKEKEVHRQRVYTASDLKAAARKAGFSHIRGYDALTFDKPHKKSDRIYIVLVK